MAIRKTAQLGHPILRQRARSLDVAELCSERGQHLIDDLIDTLRDADGVGLAAPQIHESVRVCIIEASQSPRYPGFESVPLLVLVNPVLEPIEEEGWISIYEGCLSIPGLRGQVRRSRAVRVHAMDRQGYPVQIELRDFGAIIVQHEVDHLNGMIFLDRVAPQTLTFQRELERFVPVEKRVIRGGI